jgi:hypothetical protein
MKLLSIGMSPDTLFLLAFLVRPSMSSGLGDIDEEADREQRAVDNSTTATPDMTLNTESTERSSYDIGRAIPPPHTDSGE